MDTWWEAKDADTGEMCGHRHHTKGHAMRCAEAIYMSPSAVRRFRRGPRASTGRTRARLEKRGAMMDYSDDRALAGAFARRK